VVDRYLNSLSFDAKICLTRIHLNIGNGKFSERLDRNTNSLALIDFLFAPPKSGNSFVKSISKQSGYAVSTIYQAFRKDYEEENFKIKYKKNTTRNKISELDKEKLIRWFDEYIPFQSGQDYRVLIGRLRTKFEDYRQKYPNVIFYFCVFYQSFNFFFYKLQVRNSKGFLVSNLAENFA
jgi:hypothetical protein